MLTAALLFSNALGFALQLLLPFLISPEEYSTYSLAISFSQIAILLFFEWIRLSVLKFGNQSTTQPRLASSNFIAATYIIISIPVLAGSVYALLNAQLWSSSNFSNLIALAGIIAVSQASFEGLQAYVRANHLNRQFALNWIIRSLITLTACSIVAYIFATSTSVLFAYTASFSIAATVLYWPQILSYRFARLSSNSLKTFAKYGLPLAASSAIGLGITPALKSQIAILVSPIESGVIFLLFDISQKIFAILGMAINLAFAQKTINSLGNNDHIGAKQSSHDQYIGVMAIILPLTAFLLVFQDSILLHLLPKGYRFAFFSELYLPVIVCTALLSIRMFTTDALFIAHAKPKAALIISSITFGGWIVLSRYLSLSLTATLWVLAGILFVTQIVSTTILYRCLDLFPISLDFSFIALMSTVLYYLSRYIQISIESNALKIALPILLFVIGAALLARRYSSIVSALIIKSART